MNAIPENLEPDWETIHAVPILPKTEPLVPLSLCPEKILVRSAYFEAKIAGSFPECYAREEVQTKLMQAAKLLPAGLRLVILDGWRGTELQTALFRQCYQYYQRKNHGADDATLTDLARQFVALPSTDPNAPSPHLTGGAIDLSITNREGSPLFFGAAFDHAGEISHTRYFEKQQTVRKLTKKELDARDNRRLLYQIMTEAGFVNYHREWWHFEFGTQQWALKKRKPNAFYGPAKLRLQPFS